MNSCSSTFRQIDTGNAPVHSTQTNKKKAPLPEGQKRAFYAFA